MGGRAGAAAVPLTGHSSSKHRNLGDLNGKILEAAEQHCMTLHLKAALMCKLHNPDTQDF
eukprot:2224283-Rhodomonas_salina.1